MIAIREHLAHKGRLLLEALRTDRPFSFGELRRGMDFTEEEFDELIAELKGVHGFFDTEKQALPTQKLIKRQTVIIGEPDATHRE